MRDEEYLTRFYPRKDVFGGIYRRRTSISPSSPSMGILCGDATSAKEVVTIRGHGWGMEGVEVGTERTGNDERVGRFRH